MKFSGFINQVSRASWIYRILSTEGIMISSISQTMHNKRSWSTFGYCIGFGLVELLAWYRVHTWKYKERENMLFLQWYVSVTDPFPFVSMANVVAWNFNKSTHNSKIKNAGKLKINQKSPMIISSHFSGRWQRKGGSFLSGLPPLNLTNCCK